MDIKTINREIKSKISNEIEIIAEGENRFRLFSPFTFIDGDEFCILLKKTSKGWQITDEGHTFMHLSYDIEYKDLLKGTRSSIIEDSLSQFNINNNQGILLKNTIEENIGNALFTYIQGIIKITDIDHLSRERTKSTFMEDLSSFLNDFIPNERVKNNHFLIDNDPQGKYPIDFFVNGMERPLFIFGILNDSKVKDVTVNILQYERWGILFKPVAIFENQETINRKDLARFSDVVDRQFSNLVSNKNRIKTFTKELMQ